MEAIIKASPVKTRRKFDTTFNMVLMAIPKKIQI